MRILFVLASKPNKNSMNVCLRNLAALERGLAVRGHTVAWWTIASDPDPGSLMRRERHRGETWDVICCVYATRFIHMDYVDQLLGENPKAKLGWWTTEYDINRPYGFKDLEFVLLNYEEAFYAKRKKFYRRALVANYNALVAEPLHRETPKSRDCIYYGRYRPDRAEYFRLYLNDPIVELSTSKRNVKNYHREGIRGAVLDKMSWAPGRETLGIYRTSLYIEDKLTHTIYNHPASRWYESIACRTYPVVDITCMRTMRMAGIELPEDLWIDGPEYIPLAVKWTQQPESARWLERWTQQGLEERSRTITATADFLESL